MKLQVLTVFLLYFLTWPAGAQEIITLERVMEEALKNNHQIKTYETNAKIAENTHRPGAAGLLPTVTANAGIGYSNKNTSLEMFSNPNPIEQNGAQSYSGNASLNLQYVLFDGLASYKSFARLGFAADIENANTRASIEATLINVVTVYYGMVAAQNNVSVAQENITISRDRWQRADERYSTGSTSGVEVLSAKVDMNTDSVLLLNALNNLRIARENLRMLTAYSIPEACMADTSILLGSEMLLSELEKLAAQNNASLVNARLRKLLTEKDVEISGGAYAPKLMLNGSYGYNWTKNEVGFLLQNKTLGLDAGISLVYPLFSGGTRDMQRQNAKLQYESAKEMEMLTNDQLRRDLTNAYSSYETARSVHLLEELNAQSARENFLRTREIYLLGKATNVQLREAQLNYLRSRIQITTSKINVRLSEFELLRLSGLLIQRKS
jgi:outer membrane protein TolC